jgi:hypothetical protein
MSVKQISVFLENKAGRLWEVCKVLAEAGVNIRALSVADTADFGIVRMIVDVPDKAVGELKQAGFTVAETNVIAVEIPDRPGGLAEVLEVLKQANINVEYLYCFVDKARKGAIDVMRVEEIEEASQKLKEVGVKILGGDELYNI